MSTPKLIDLDGLRSLADLLTDLVRIPSPYGDELALCDAVQASLAAHQSSDHVRLNRLGNSLLVVPRNLDGWAEGTAKAAIQQPPPPIILMGHLDTVQPPPGTGPIRREGDRLHGPGASDMKGGVALMLKAFATLPPSHLPPMVFYDREEGPYQGSGLQRVIDSHPANLADTELAIVLEPTDNQVQVGCLGSAHIKVRFHGRSCHSARPWCGENPIHKAAPFLAQVAQIEPREVTVGGYTFVEVMTITQAHGAAPTRNVIPDSFDLNLNYRFPPNLTSDEAVQRVQALVGDRADLVVEDLSPSGPIPKDNRWVDDLIQRTGKPAGPKQAWTDVARLGVHGVDAVCFGPGKSDQAHQADEYAPVAALQEGWEILRDFLMNVPAR